MKIINKIPKEYRKVNETYIPILENIIMSESKTVKMEITEEDWASRRVYKIWDFIETVNKILCLKWIMWINDEEDTLFVMK